MGEFTIAHTREKFGRNTAREKTMKEIVTPIRICVNIDLTNYRKIYKSLAQVVHNDQIISSLKIYRAKKGQSKLIPILMKYQLVSLLMLACTVRGRKRYGKKL